MVSRFRGPQRGFSSQLVNGVVGALRRSNRTATKDAWLSAVHARAVAQKPGLAPVLSEILGVEPSSNDLLANLGIGEIGVCYEALLAHLDSDSRRDRGQFFTPDDAARFMADQAKTFPKGVWLDPCCGVGNLAWHLASVQDDPAEFVANRLVLMDKDRTALLSAIALIAGDFINDGDEAAMRRLYAVSQPPRDALTKKPLPDHDFVIMNPPYARAAAPACITHTGSCQDLFAYFMERVALSSRGFVAVTPASYLSAPKFKPMRTVLDETMSGGDIYVFDNVPDTLFRGYKYGSNNTSTTNFVRAAITVCSPTRTSWRVTPILRWKAVSRSRMFESASTFLAPRQSGPSGEWAKLIPGLETTWKRLLGEPRRLRDLLSKRETPWRLDVGTTPRYYISASTRPLDRGSKAELYFPDRASRDLALLVLNSSLPYLMWRALDGGVTLPLRVLLGVPVPDLPGEHSALIDRLIESCETNVVTKLNAGRNNENIHHPDSLVRALDELVIPEAVDALDTLYSPDMFASL